jgi:DNA-binding Lrp family transcriptional regulator
MDNIDKKILSVIQAKAATPLSEISRKVGVSTTPCWNRIKRMEEEKLIKGRITVLDRNKINLPIVVFLSIAISNQSTDWVIRFTSVIQKYNQIIEVHRLTGSSADYILKIVATSIEDYDSFQQTLISEIEFTQMSSSISLHEMKQTHLLPLEQVRN